MNRIMASPTEELQALMNKLVNKACSLEVFKVAAMLLVNQGADPSVQDTTDRRGTLLQHLVFTNSEGTNNKEITELLKRDKNLVNVKNGFGLTSLQYLMNKLINFGCSLADFKKSAMLLVNNGADLTVKDRTNTQGTLLHHLVRTNKEGVNDKEIAQVLKLNKDLVNSTNLKGQTPLQYLMNELVYTSCSLSDFKKSAMLLVNNGADLTLKDTTNSYVHGSILHHLVRTNKGGVNDKEIAEVLALKKDLVCITNHNGQTPLQCLMNELIYNTCSLTDFKNSAMILARNGADLSLNDTTHHKGTLLHLLVIKNTDGVNNKEINELLKLNPNFINIKNNDGRTPLQNLLRIKDNVSIGGFEYMLQLGSDLYSKDNNHETLLHACCYSGNLELAKYLVTKGFELGAKTITGQTLWHSSVGSNNAALWQWLYDNKVDIDAQDNSEQTPLHLAAKQDNKDMVQWLIQHQANLNVKDNKGNTPLDIAQRNGVEEIIDLLVAAGATNSITQSTQEPAKNRKVDSAALSYDIKSKEKLLATIREMKEYGILLKNEGASKGQIAIDLAEALQSKTEEFFRQSDATTQLPEFKKQFSTLLNSKNNEMSEYRVSWDTIIINVAIALTGIGALLMIGQLLYSKATEGRALFFFQKSQTTSEEKIDAVSKSVAELN